MTPTHRPSPIQPPIPSPASQLGMQKKSPANPLHAHARFRSRRVRFFHVLQAGAHPGLSVLRPASCRCPPLVPTQPLSRSAAQRTDGLTDIPPSRYSLQPQHGTRHFSPVPSFQPGISPHTRFSVARPCRSTAAVGFCSCCMLESTEKRWGGQNVPVVRLAEASRLAARVECLTTTVSQYMWLAELLCWISELSESGRLLTWK